MTSVFVRDSAWIENYTATKMVKVSKTFAGMKINDYLCGVVLKGRADAPHLVHKPCREVGLFVCPFICVLTRFLSLGI